MSWAAALAAVAGFAALLRGLGVPRRAGEVGVQVRSAVAVTRDRTLDEPAKERAVRRAATRLGALSLWIVGATVIAAALPAGVVLLLDRAGLVDARGVAAVSTSPPFLLAAAALSLVVLRPRGRATP